MIVLPLVALVAAGVSSFLWYKAHYQSRAVEYKEQVKERLPAAPEEFSGNLGERLSKLMADYGVGEKDIRRVKPDSAAGDVRTVYKVNIPSSTSLTLVHLKIHIMAEENGGEVLKGVESADGRILSLTLGARTRPTDLVIVQRIPGKESRQAIVAVIVDDFGLHEIGNARRLRTIGQTVTLSVFPFQPFTAALVEFAASEGMPYLLHMPMEPHSSTENPGEGAIMVSDSDDAIRRKLSAAFESVKGAPGMNNHMGSRATEDIRIMETVMHYLRDNGRFFIDSRTSNRSVAFEVSQRIRVKCSVMAGYLDVIDERSAIRKRLFELVESAFERGPVIIIGHSRPFTIEVLEQELPRLAEQGVRFVGVEEVVK
jgi:polysaccharide deacetylase 2 family uncharacterized protein YibQ